MVKQRGRPWPLTWIPGAGSMGLRPWSWARRWFCPRAFELVVDRPGPPTARVLSPSNQASSVDGKAPSPRTSACFFFAAGGLITPAISRSAHDENAWAR